MSIRMVLDVKGLEDVVVVGFGSQKRITSTGAVSTVKGEEIRSVPTANIQNTLVGRNEATLNDAYGQSQIPVLPFTPDDLQKFKDGSDPYGHPNVNWSDVLMNKSSTQSRYNVDVSGGNAVVKYFTSLGYYSANGILKDFKPIGEEVNTNYFYRRFNYRSNLDITPTKTLKIRFDVNGRFETVNNPSGGQEANGLFYEL
eukprot:gene8753-11842_t